MTCQRMPIHPRHTNVADDEVWQALGNMNQGLFATAHRIDFIAFPAQTGSYGSQQIWFVINNK